MRLDEEHERYIAELANVLHQSKSDLIFDAIKFYVENRLKNERDAFVSAIVRTRDKDSKVAREYDGALDDGL